MRSLADICSITGRHTEALAYARESLALIAPLGDRVKILVVLTNLAVIHLRAGDPETAGLLWGGIEGAAQRSFLGFWAMRCEAYAAELNGCTDAAFERARLIGQRRALTDLIAEQLATAG